MKGLMEEYGNVLVYGSVAVSLIAMITILYTTQLNTIVPKISKENHVSTNAIHTEYSKPNISLTKEIKIAKGQVFDYLEDPQVLAMDQYDGNITDDVKWYSLGTNLNINQQGVYGIRYVAVNSKGLKTEEKVKVIVE